MGNQAEEILNKKSGWKALTGTTDFGEISSSQEPACKLAFEIFVDRILHFIGSYYVKLEGQVDALVFAGGIGEKGALLRTRIVEKCECLGFELDEQTNNNKIEDVVRDVGTEGARHRTLVCQTDEQVSISSNLQPLMLAEVIKVRNGEAMCRRLARKLDRKQCNRASTTYSKVRIIYMHSTVRRSRKIRKIKYEHQHPSPAAPPYRLECPPTYHGPGFLRASLPKQQPLRQSVGQ